MCHQHRHRHRLQNPTGSAAEHKFAQPGMAVSAHDDEVGGTVGRVGQHHVADVDIRGDQPLDLDIEIVAGEMFAKIGSGQFVHFAASARYHNDFDKLSALKEGQ